MGPGWDPWAFEPPAHFVVPEWDYTLGGEVADFCSLLGFAPDPEQEMILDAAFGVKDGLPAASEGAVVAGRQTVKSSSLEMVSLGWMFVTREPLAIWSAHEFSTTLETFLHMQKLIEGNRWASAKVKRFYASGSGVRVQMWDGRRMLFVARTTSGGRGKVAPKMILDEGLELLPEHLGALSAITSTWPDAQRFMGSSGAKAYSSVLHAMIRRGRAGAMGRGMFFEWADDLPGGCVRGVECTHVQGTPGCRADDPRRYRRANPTVGRIRPDGRGLTFDAIAKERAEQPDPLIFVRERLTEHDEPDAAAAQVFTEEVWTSKDLLDAKSKIVGEPWFALQVSPSQDWAAIMVAGRAKSGRIHVETTSQRRGDLRVYNRRASTDWVVPWFRARLEKRGGKPARYESMRLVVLAGSAAASLLPALERIENLDIAVLPESQMPAACGLLLGAVARQELVHVGDPELTASMTAVGRRMVGEKAFVWSPRSSSGDITAAQGATLAVWQVEQEADDYDPLDSIG